MISGAFLGFIATFWYRQKVEEPFSWLRTIPITVVLFFAYFIISLVLTVMSGREPGPGFGIGAVGFAFTVGITLRMQQEVVEIAIRQNWLKWIGIAYALIFIILTYIAETPY